MITGRSCRIFKNTEQHAAVEKGDGLIPWNGQQDNLIDRFDGRALLDFYRDPPAHRQQREKTHEEAKLDEVCNYYLPRGPLPPRRAAGLEANAFAGCLALLLVQISIGSVGLGPKPVGIDSSSELTSFVWNHASS